MDATAADLTQCPHMHCAADAAGAAITEVQTLVYKLAEPEREDGLWMLQDV